LPPERDCTSWCQTRKSARTSRWLAQAVRFRICKSKFSEEKKLNQNEVISQYWFNDWLRCHSMVPSPGTVTLITQVWKTSWHVGYRMHSRRAEWWVTNFPGREWNGSALPYTKTNWSLNFRAAWIILEKPPFRRNEVSWSDQTGNDRTKVIY
jgi:hypothetical protein